LLSDRKSIRVTDRKSIRVTDRKSIRVTDRKSIRVFYLYCSGTLSTGSYALNSNKGTRERIGRLLLMHANSREDVDVARTGDIVAVAGLKNVITGETLCDEKKPVILERMDVSLPTTCSLLTVHLISSAA